MFEFYWLLVAAEWSRELIIKKIYDTIIFMFALQPIITSTNSFKLYQPVINVFHLKQNSSGIHRLSRYSNTKNVFRYTLYNMKDFSTVNLLLRSVKGILIIKFIYSA